MKFEVGEKVYVKRIGGDLTISEIIHLKESNDSKGEYYVHYEGYNRRLDEWVSESRIISECDFDKQNQTYSSLKNDMDLTDKKMTRQQKRKFDEMHHVQKSYSDMDPTTAALEKDYIERTKIKYINKVIIGQFEIDTWYYSPYPAEYERVPLLYVCEKCLKYMALEKTYTKHSINCEYHTPPGRLVYSEGDLRIHEINGSEHKLYCQNLCLLAKFFLDHKTLYFDVLPFLFYILYEKDSTGYHVASYFSKEKESIDNYNVACILTFPPYQRKGYGKFMISLSYELSKKENKVGTPEKPLSDLGHLSYRSYWSYVILDYLRKNATSVLSINELSIGTGIGKNDLIETLQILNLLKYWKGNYVACFSSKLIDEHLKNGYCRPPKMKINPELLLL